jgi:hypothetical protein
MNNRLNRGELPDGIQNTMNRAAATAGAISTEASGHGSCHSHMTL